MQREIDFRFKLLRNGADYGFLRALGAPTIRCDDNGAIKTSLSANFLPAAYDADGNEIELDLLKDEIEPILVIDETEYPLGVFLAATVTETEQDGARILSVEAYDRCWKVRDTYTETLLYLEEDTYYDETVEELLTAAGISTALITPSAAVFAEDREGWNIGTSYLSIINELLSEINYKPLWFNSQGIAIVEPASVPTAANIQHTLDATNVESLLELRISRETDIYQAPNVFLCICDNPDKSGLMSASAENTNPQSPLSIPRRGRRIVHVEKVRNIADQTELQAYADRMRNESMITGESIQVSTGLLPGFGVADVTAIRWGELSAICIERSWEMSLQVGGTMRHTLERVVYNIE